MSPVALITGSSRGIGRAIAEKLAEDGWSVVINYCRDEAAAAEVCDKICHSGGHAIAIQADVGIEEDVLRLFAQAREAFGGIDLLVNNAGVASFGLLTDLSAADWRRIFATNVDGAFFCTKAALPDMIHRKSGCIINISSIWGLVGASCEVAYSASKGALIAMTKALAKEVGPSGVRVNCVAPGVIDTAMNSALSAADMQALLDETPLGMLGSPNDIAETVAFLASDKAKFITGQVISPNGGFTIY
jgi:3-oxoacyl-[acyl-carrier protein] reductase